MTDIKETLPGSGPIHVTEEAIGYDKVMHTAFRPQSRIAGIAMQPGNSLS
jgi:hypothetical protein